MHSEGVLAHTGPLARTHQISRLFEINEQAWAEYNELLPVASGGRSNEHYMSERMMHISKITSLAVRLNSSWNLIHASMSLLRDRYEQAVRFSWLARQPDGDEASKYRRYFYGKVRSLIKNMPERTRTSLEAQFGQVPQWATEPLSKEEQAGLKEWDNLDLRTMAAKRDALPRLASLAIADDKMGDLYDGIYGQFSSVSHFDMLSLQFLKSRVDSDGRNYLDTEPHWPGLLAIQNCRMDIVQCFECLTIYHRLDVGQAFNELYVRCLSAAPAILST